ncbi:hypothetical protein EX895_002207 [Sporisorium graminicola]|uniref:Trafficking protein particle complex subunit 11 domain-containing protein n=1 Tax=Sporisorium graminicola TaxID=280036 RepID=A0A4U7KXD7_9BASI|nr:hypothetical protein EX895_002207 [Sporisorium graminicola]TKY88966.1 hypothetical protein EX895_002207 [Sporisorium graminicola]
MNAFPPELLHHHFACMVVAGLTPPAKPSAPSTTAAAAASSTTSTSSSSAAAPAAPDPNTTTSEANGSPDHPTSVFPDLTKSIHEILASRARNTLWDPSRGRAAVFHTVFADHFVRLPPLKTKPSARHVPPIPSVTTGSTANPSDASTAAFSALPPRSPLSPLHPNSPQFPDGLIAPVWVRKHRELVPSVFVSFYCLPTDSDIDQLRTADEALIKTISERRRTLTERGIKLTVVLLTQRETLDDPQLEARLSFVRRNSGLDSRASLFVLTPVTKSELVEFVTSLHSALFEPAADYYREHARRVKRKRTRYPPPPSTLHPLATALGTLPSSRPGGKTLGVADISWLSREGWIVRSEYKLAVFAELAGDMHEAALRYREAYDLLCNSPTCLLGSTLMLPPRTKRWAEAKVLADTLSVRICKLLLYADDGEGAAVFFRRHLARFTELSTGWGIGAMTFEYWSWLAKQYRMFGELVEHATRAVPGSPLPPFQLSVHAPPLPSRLIHPDALPRLSDGRGGVVAPPGMLLPNSNAVAVSTCPYTELQSPGAYYYLAALCTLERRERFLRATSSQPTAQEDQADSTSPLAHERKVDHTAHLTESLTKAYDSFKRNRLHRAALLVAARIATAYYDGGHHEMALKFLERILKNYTKDQVYHVRASLIETALQAAIAVRDQTSAVKMLVEVLDPSLPIEEARRKEMVNAVKTFLSQSVDDVEVQQREEAEGEAEDKENSGASTAVVVAGFLSADVVFPAAEVEFGAEAPFQVVIRNTAESFDLRDVLTAQRVTLHLESGDEAYPSVVEIQSSGNASSSTPLIVDLGQIDLTSAQPKSASADLSTVFAPTPKRAGTIAFQGRFKANRQGLIRIVGVTLHAAASTRLGLQLDIALPDQDTTVVAADTASSSGLNPVQWLLPTGRSLDLTQRLHPSITLVKPKRFNVSLHVATTTLIASPCAFYLDECIPLTISVENHESQPLHAWIDAILQPSYDGANDTLSSSDDAASGGEGGTKQSVVGWELETVEASGTVETVVWLTARQAAGVRVVDVCVRVAADAEGRGEGEDVAASAKLDVTVGKLFECKTWIQPQRGEGKRGQALLDFDDDDGREAAEEAEQVVGLDVTMAGADTVQVTQIELMSGEDVVSSPIDDDQQASMGEWFMEDRFSFFRHVASDPTHWRITWTRPTSTRASASLIPIPTPSLAPTSTTNQPNLTLTLDHPLHATLHAPFDVSLTVHNHHTTRSFSLVLTLDSDEHFTLAGSRRLSIPHLLPRQQLDLGAFVRLIPQCVGCLHVPGLAVRLVDPLDPAATLAVVASDGGGGGGESTEAEAEDAWAKLVRFRYKGEEGLRKVVVSL